MKQALSLSPVMAVLVTATALFVPSLSAQSAAFSSVFVDQSVYELENGRIVALDETGVFSFESWQEYVASDYFERNGKQCGAAGLTGGLIPVSQSDCSSGFTNPAAQYDPSVTLYRIPVVVHILQSPNGNGAISDATVQSQIDVLNEDFLALSGSNGALGTDSQIEFYLAAQDPSGNPTTGITRHTKNQWYNDSGNYASAVGWDTNRYLNIYTNTAGGNLGYAYVPNGGGVVGSSFDGVRILWTAFGRNAPIGPPYNLGRTATHEVGHYLGLYHTFAGGCASVSNCFGNGDLICDTNPEGQPNQSGCTQTTCGNPDPANNYMDYSPDSCMTEFTSQQSRRMRCTLESWRVDLFDSGSGGGNTAPSVSINAPSNGATFDDGDTISFSGSANDAEDGNLSGSLGWSSSLDGALGGGTNLATTLSVGTHTVTASVTDSGGASGSDAITVTVNSVGGGGGISLSGNSYKVKGRVRVDLTWAGATGGSVDVYYNGGLLTATNNDGAYTHLTGLKGSGSLQYQVCDGTGCSAVITVVY